MNAVEKKRIVVKVGTSTLTHKTGKTNIARMAKLASVLADLHNMGNEVVLVSSGAIGIGYTKLGLKKRPETIKGLYDKFFGEYGVVVSQLLFTSDALRHSDGKKHLIDTFNQLFEYGSIPIVNENDSVSVEELSSGDNDSMSANVATLINADILILLTDTDGLYDSNPNENPDAQLIHTVEKITPEIESVAGGAGKNGTGGFITKVNAAKHAVSNGIPVVVTNGKKPTDIYKILNGEQIGTRFVAE